MTIRWWKGRRVLITGHTGFKGGWLSLWLGELGAKVAGYSLEPSTFPSLFEGARVRDAIEHHAIGDVRDYENLSGTIRRFEPEVVFHLAAQPLVRRSYVNPVETFTTNVLGTVNVLEAVRHCESVRALVNVTTDKCYENNEWIWGYRETEALGGRDPYSSSKACSELVTSAYRSSFLLQKNVAVATARAGNVVGGGDWAEDRLIPDFFRARTHQVPLYVRNPDAVRPWQHVFDPLDGYIRLAEALLAGESDCVGAWNFGPTETDVWSVRRVLDQLVELAPGCSWKTSGAQSMHEATYLKLDSSKARVKLKWKSAWETATALAMTVQWQDSFESGQSMQNCSLRQLQQYWQVSA